MAPGSAFDVPPFPARVRLYQENRRRFRPEQLLPFAGQWIAFSADGMWIVASDQTLADLETHLAALGVDPKTFSSSKSTWAPQLARHSACN